MTQIQDYFHFVLVEQHQTSYDKLQGEVVGFL